MFATGTIQIAQDLVEGDENFAASTHNSESPRWSQNVSRRPDTIAIYFWRFQSLWGYKSEIICSYWWKGKVDDTDAIPCMQAYRLILNGYSTWVDTKRADQTLFWIFTILVSSEDADVSRKSTSTSSWDKGKSIRDL